MTTRGRSAHAANSHEGTNLRRRRNVGGVPEVAVVTEERIAQEREALVHDRQQAVVRILDQHDTLVREAFHMEKFVSLLAYDPKVRSRQTSMWLRDFNYRLGGQGRQFGRFSRRAGPSRTTRRAHHDRLDALKAPPNASISAPPILQDNRKPKKISKPRNGPTPNPTFWSIVEEAKSKDKGKSKTTSPEKNHTSISAGPSRNGKGKQKDLLPFGVSPALGGQSARATDIPATTAHTYPKRITLPLDPHAADQPHDPSPRKKRKIAIFDPDRPPDLAAGLDAVPATSSMANSKGVTSLPKRPPSRPQRMRSAHSDIPNGPASSSSPSVVEASSSTVTPSSSKPPTTIRRVKLIVRRPPPSLSNPKQRPPQPKHGESLTSLLSSYINYDSQELPSDPYPDEIERNVQKQAAFWTHVDKLRREGKLLYIPDSDDHDPSSQPADIRKDPDVWDFVVNDATAIGRAKFISGPLIAAQIASKIKSYWEGVSAREDKMRSQEEQKKKVMARKLARDVTAAWSKALAHIRHEARLALEEEERRRGHEHLDDILKNAGKILEAQHVELFRGDTSSPSSSRSSSVSGHDSDDDNDEGSEVATERASDDEDDGFDTTALLGDTAAFIREDTGTSMGGDQPESSVAMEVEEPEASVSEQMDQDILIPSSRSYSPLQSSAPRTPASFTESIRDSPFQGSPRRESEAPSTPRQEREPLSPFIHEVEEPEQVVDLTTGDATPTQQKVVTFVVDSGIYVSSPASERDQNVPETLETAPHSASFLDGDEPRTAEPESGDVDPSQAPEVVETTELQDVPGDDNDDDEVDASIPSYLRPYAVTPIDWDPQTKIKPPPLLRGTLRPYQQAGLEWLASIHGNNLNGILADEMGLGKTIQTIALLAHLACDRGIWGPHLIIVPTSVLLNWEMEFKKFLPGFKVLSYHGNTKRRKELRQGWNNKYHFNVCVTSYTLASRDAHVFKRKPWYYMILDEAHMIKNFKSQRWNILLMFRSFRRLLLTGTPLQNNLTELWSLLQFLMSGTNFANLKEFGDWFSNPLEKAIELGTVLDDENQRRVTKLHTVLRPYLLRRLKKDVERELPSKFEHLVMCPLSKRQRYLYDEFMSRAETRHDLQSGVYQKIANILMQLRKVVNHPDLFEVRPIRTSFAMQRSAIADYEIKELLVRRKLFQHDDEHVNLNLLGFRFIDNVNTPLLVAQETRRLDGTLHLPFTSEIPEEPPPDYRTIAGYRKYREYQQRIETIARWSQTAYVNALRCSSSTILSSEAISLAKKCSEPLLPLPEIDMARRYWTTSKYLHAAIKPYSQRTEEMIGEVEAFTFATPAVVALDLPHIALQECETVVSQRALDTSFDTLLHRASVKLQIAFPDASLLQYDCGKLQKLAELLRERKAGGHRVLIFTQMTRILDILEIFLNLNGYLYLRLDGATKIEDRQYITERFNCDSRVFCFIASSRSGGVGINLTGADTVIFYDSDFNPQMDRQCEDRAHRIGQIRDVHIYRFISQHTVEEALLRKANQKRNLDDIVIQKGEFDWRSFVVNDEAAFTRALGEFEDTEDAEAAIIAAKEAAETEGADEADFGWEGATTGAATGEAVASSHVDSPRPGGDSEQVQQPLREGEEDEEEEEDGGSIIDYMIAFIRADMEYFSDWR